jgi:hypothetical protein
LFGPEGLEKTVCDPCKRQQYEMRKPVFRDNRFIHKDLDVYVDVGVVVVIVVAVPVIVEAVIGGAGAAATVSLPGAGSAAAPAAPFIPAIAL